MGKFLEEEEPTYAEDLSDTDFQEYDEDAWATELKLKLEHAMEVWIASAYVDMRAVDMLENILRSVPPGCAREIRFLLDEEFHENPLAREAIINRLYALPNTKIRLTNTKDKFHPKCYIFNQGSYTSCLVGSMNLTGGALRENIEFGIFSDQPEHVRTCREFFIKYWSKGKEAPKTERIDYPKQKFAVGNTVVHKISHRIGCVSKVDNLKEPYHYYIFFGLASPEWIPEDELEPRQIFDIARPNIRSFFQTPADEKNLDIFLQAYLYERYYTPAEEGHYASQTSRIEDEWYQKIPLFKILSSIRPCLLIADEVGLGKTIEAGLIIKEMMGRMTLCRRILVLCPKNLTQKWELEMRLRFGMYFTMRVGRDAENFIEELKKQKDASRFNTIVPYESLRKKQIIQLIRQAKVSMDIIVCDEAHHLRNENLQQQAVRALAYHNRCMLMLTATPINLSSKELRILLGILYPERYSTLDEEGWKSFITPNIYISKLYAAIAKCIEFSNEDYVTLSTEVYERNGELCSRILNSPLYGNNFSIDHPLRITTTAILGHKESGNKPIPIEEVKKLADSVINSNVLAQSLTRTLKKDIGKFNVREVKTVKVRLESEKEKAKYFSLIDEAKKYYKFNPNKRIGAYQLLRQASSCIPVISSIKDTPISNKEGDADLIISEKKLTQYTITEEQISFPDSKFTELEKIIDEARKNEPDYRILIFCIFIKTIKYLEARINKKYGPDTVSIVYGDIADLDERYSRIDNFSKPGNPHILICSELASEGIDLQFCHILVNYDLPWNPTKVEQRIGRIDRYGQTADIIRVFNLVVEGTIEEIIYSRLGNRIEDARNTLGPVAEVLGKIERELPDQFLRLEFNEVEKGKYAKMTDRNLKLAQEEQKKYEEESLQLISPKEAFKRELIERKKGSVDHAEIVARYLILKNKSIFSLESADKGEKIIINEKHKEGLLREFGRYLKVRDKAEQLRYLRPKIANGIISVVFDQKNATKTNAEFLCIDNPLIKHLLLKNRKRLDPNQMIFVSTEHEDISTGKYIITEYECSVVIGPIKYDYIFHQSAFRLIDGQYVMVNDFDILSALFRFDRWKYGSRFEIDENHLEKIEIDSRKAAEELFSTKYEKIVAQIKMEEQNRRQAYKELHSRENLQIEERIKRTVDPNIKRRLSNELKKLEKEVQKLIQEIPSSEDIVFNPRLLMITAIQRR